MNIIAKLCAIIQSRDWLHLPMMSWWTRRDTCEQIFNDNHNVGHMYTYGMYALYCLNWMSHLWKVLWFSFTFKMNGIGTKKFHNPWDFIYLLLWKSKVCSRINK